MNVIGCDVHSPTRTSAVYVSDVSPLNVYEFPLWSVTDPASTPFESYMVNVAVGYPSAAGHGNVGVNDICTSAPVTMGVPTDIGGGLVIR